MNKKILLIGLLIIGMLTVPMFMNVGVHGSEDRVLTHPEADLNRDGIDDSFEVEMADAIASGRGDQMVTVFSQFSTAPTDQDVAIFEQYGGILVSRLFTRGPRCLGFAGKIPYNRIVDYVAGNIRIGYLEDFDAGPSLNMAYETTQAVVRAESMPTNCDYNHVVTLFGAVAIDYWYQPLDRIGDMPDLSKEPVHVFQLLKNSTLGLPYDSDCNLFKTRDIPFSIYPPSPVLRLATVETIDMRDVAQAIQNYGASEIGETPKIGQGTPEIEQGVEGGCEDRVLTHPEADKNRNGIKDDLEVAIADAIASGRGDQCVKVFSQFSVAPTDDDVAIFKEYGGIVTSQLFTRGPRFLGFFGEIPYNRIVDYAAANIRIGFIEEYQRTIEVYISPMLP